MTVKRSVFSMCFDNELIADINYYANTTPTSQNRSRAIENALRNVIPRRNLSISNTSNQ